MFCVKGRDDLFHIPHKDLGSRWGALCYSHHVAPSEIQRTALHDVAPTCFACIDASAQLASAQHQQQTTLAVMATRRKRT